VCLTGGSRLSAPTSALTPLPPSLAALWGRADAVLFPRALSLSLFCRPHLSAAPNLPPTISPPWTRPRPRVLWPRPSPRAPFKPRTLLAHPLSHLRPLPNSLALSLALPTQTGSSAIARRRPLPVAWLPSHPCLVQCHGELCLTVSCSGHPSMCPLPPCCVRSALTGEFSCAARVRHRLPVEPLCLRRCFVTPALLLEVSNLPVPLIWSSPLYSSRDCSSEQSSAAVSPLRRGLRPLAPLRQREGHGRVRQIARIAPRPVPKPREPRCGRPARFRQTLATRPSGATAFRSDPQPLDLGRPSEIGWFRFHLCGSDRSPSIWIRPLSPLPLTRAPALGPGRSARPGSLVP
jgi:hypothetical protein